MMWSYSNRIELFVLWFKFNEELKKTFVFLLLYIKVAFSYTFPKQKNSISILYTKKKNYNSAKKSFLFEDFVFIIITDKLVHFWK